MQGGVAAKDKWDSLAWTPITNFYFTDDAPFAVVKAPGLHWLK